MAISDDLLIRWLSHGDAKVRNVALEILTGSFSQDASIVPTIFKNWDRFGVDAAYPEFQLVSYLPIQEPQVAECLHRAAAMIEGRKLTDRVCRCAGKLLESVSVHPPEYFKSHLPFIRILHASSKIFFRVALDWLQVRSDALHRPTHSLLADLNDGNDNDVAIALECLYYRHEADSLIRRGLHEAATESQRSSLANATMALATRLPLESFESQLLGLIEHRDLTVSDAATIGLARCRDPKTPSLIAEAFPKLSRLAQLRAIEVVRRGRFPKSSELLRYLLPHGVDFSVQDAIRIAEVMVFDFEALEDWLEAYLLADEQSLSRISSSLALVEPLGQEIVPDELNRILKLVESRKIIRT
jgi:hypothetical protein